MDDAATYENRFMGVGDSEFKFEAIDDVIRKTLKPSFVFESEFVRTARNTNTSFDTTISMSTEGT